MKRPFVQTIIPGCLLFMIFLSLTGCVQPGGGVGFTGEISLEPPPLPKYLVLVKPTGTLSMAEYNEARRSINPSERGLVIGFTTNMEESDSKTSRMTALMGRVSMYLDGKPVSGETMSIMDLELRPGYGPFIFSWSPALSPGMHRVEFQLTDASGETQQYTWNFLLTEK